GTETRPAPVPPPDRTVSRKLDQAAHDFDRAVALNPKQYNAYLNLAHVCLAEKQFDRAAVLAQVAFQFRAPVSAVVGYHVERARVLQRDKRYEEALQECDSALKLSADEPACHEARARALLALAHYEQAE